MHLLGRRRGSAPSSQQQPAAPVAADATNFRQRSASVPHASRPRNHFIAAHGPPRSITSSITPHKASVASARSQTSTFSGATGATKGSTLQRLAHASSDFIPQTSKDLAHKTARKTRAQVEDVKKQMHLVASDKDKAAAKVRYEGHSRMVSYISTTALSLKAYSSAGKTDVMRASLNQLLKDIDNVYDDTMTLARSKERDNRYTTKEELSVFSTRLETLISRTAPLAYKLDRLAAYHNKQGGANVDTPIPMLTVF